MPSVPTTPSRQGRSARARGVIYEACPRRATRRRSSRTDAPRDQPRLNPPFFYRLSSPGSNPGRSVKSLLPLHVYLALPAFPPPLLRQSQSTHTARNVSHSQLKSRSGGSTGKRTPTLISPTTQCSKVDLFLGPIIINQNNSYTYNNYGTIKPN